MRHSILRFFACTLLACLSLAAIDEEKRHDGAYLNALTLKYPAENHCFSGTGKRLNILFILNRSGARDGVEFLSLMPSDYDAVLTFDRKTMARNNAYEQYMQGTSIGEKRRELTQKLNRKHDLIILSGVKFEAFPKAIQNRIATKVKAGTPLLRICLMPEDYSEQALLKGTPVPIPFSSWIDADIKAEQVEKGRVVTVIWKRHTPYNEPLSMVAEREYDSYHRSRYTSDLANIALLARFAAGCPVEPESPQVRIRDLLNKIVEGPEKTLAGGSYFRDVIGKNGAFRVEPFEVASPVGTLDLKAPYESQRKRFSCRISWTRPDASVASAMVELVDSPYRRIWFRGSVPVAPKANAMNIEVDASLLPSMAGYVRVTLQNKAGRALAATEKPVFFPDRSIPDYMQLVWASSRTEATAKSSVERLGFRYVLTAGFDNYVTRTALLDQKLVTYTSGNIVFLLADKEGRVTKPAWPRWPEMPDKDYCFYKPEVKALWSQKGKELYRDLKPAIYNLGDELRFSYYAGYGKADERYFREFLSAKYGSIDALNKNWLSNYKSFDEIPVTIGRDKTCFSAWFDHRAYMEKMYSDVLHLLRDEVLSRDPEGRVGFEGSMPGNFEQTYEGFDYMGPYQHNVRDEMMRSFFPKLYRTIWWGGYPNNTHGSRNEYPLLLVETLLKGSVNGNAFYANFPGHNHSAVASDARISEYVARLLPVLDQLRWGLAQFFIKNELENQGILIYWSHPSLHALLLDERCGDPMAHKKVFGMSDETLQMNDWSIPFWDPETITPVLRWLYHRGEGFDFVSDRTLDRLQNARLLFLCGTPALSDKEAEAIREFVKRGGTVIADINPGILNENLSPRKKGALPELFGAYGFNKAPVPVEGAVSHPKFRASATHVAGTPIQVKTFGKGKAILLNFALAGAAASADPATPLDTLLDSLAPFSHPCKVSPALTDGMLRIRRNPAFVSYGVLNILDPVWEPGMLQKKSLCGAKERSYEIALPAPKYIYEADRGFLGRTERLQADFRKGPLHVFNAFDTEQKPPRFSFPDCYRGKAVAFTHPDLVKGRVYRLEIFDSKGNALRREAFDEPGNLPLVAFELNLAPGTLRARLTDVATGLFTENGFQLK